MYTGTLIEDLIAAVERTEQLAEAPTNLRDEKLAYCYVPAPYEMGQRDTNLLGVA